MRIPYASILILALVIGCSSMQAGYEHGFTERNVRGQVLSTKSGPGQERLAVEMKYDPAVRNFVGEQPSPPDYIYVQDRHNLQLIYLNDDRTVYFERSGLMTNSQATVVEGIPARLVSLFPRSAQDKLKQVRSVDQSTAQED